MGSGVHIQKDIKSADVSDVAHLFLQAFARKLQPILGHRDDAYHYLVDNLDLSRVIAATSNGKIVGIAGYHDQGRQLVVVTLRRLCKQYGLWAGLKQFAWAVVSARSPKANELLMDGISVHSDYRGRGIGSQLLDAICELAAELGKEKIRLDVINTNPDAKRLYERKGFVVTKTQELNSFSKAFGFESVSTMVRNIS